MPISKVANERVFHSINGLTSLGLAMALQHSANKKKKPGDAYSPKEIAAGLLGANSANSIYQLINSFKK